MEFSTERWASHDKGEKTREEILSALERSPQLSIAELSKRVGIGERQIRRQLSNLVSENRIRKAETGYVSTSIECKYLSSFKNY